MIFVQEIIQEKFCGQLFAVLIPTFEAPEPRCVFPSSTPTPFAKVDFELLHDHRSLLSINKLRRAKKGFLVPIRTAHLFLDSGEDIDKSLENNTGSC